MGEYEPNDSRNVTGQASTQDGHWTGQAANDPTRQDRQQMQQGGQAQQQGFTQEEAAQSGRQGQQQAGQGQGLGQQQQGGQSIGQQNDGVSNASNQGNDHTSAMGGGRSGQPQQFQNTAGQQGGGGSGQSGGIGRFADQIAKHQEVVDAQGNHVGTVDHIDGDRIKLTKADSADGQHHYVSLSQVDGIEGGRVRLSGSGDVAR